MITKNKHFSFIDNLSFDNLSQLLNDLGIMTHPMSNEQKVCIEYPNINIENKLLNIFETKKDNDNLSQDENELPSNKDQNKQSHDEYTLNLTKNKTYTINPTKLYDEFNKDIPYSIEEFKNSLKIFTSIFNCFNEDLFKWNLEDFNLFNDDNKIQLLNINQESIINTKSKELINDLYQKHFSVNFDYDEMDVIDVYTNINSNEINPKPSKDDFEDDFEASIRVPDNSEFKFDLNKNQNSNNININNNLYSYEKDKIFRNIYLLMNFFNLMNTFHLADFNLDNILKNITLLNSHIINNYKILLLITFNIFIQINLFLNKVTVNNFLKINTNSSNNTNKNSQNNNDNKNYNSYFPNIFFLDYQNRKKAKEENELIKEQIILLNIIIKLFTLTNLYKNKIFIKLNIKIFSIDFFKNIKTHLIFPENIFQYLPNINKIFDFIQNNEFTDLFFSSTNNSKNFFSIITFEQILLYDIDINNLEELTKIYYPFISNCDFVSFDTMENDTLIKYLSINYLNELSILAWALKFIFKIAKLNQKKFAFTFVFNSFSIALKKDITDKDYNINILDLMIYMGIYHYDENEMVKFISESENFHLIYKRYKNIIKCCNEYKNYNIGVRLFKNGITNKELQYYFITLILSLLNNINKKNNELCKNIILYENKFINPSKCIFLNIKTNNIEKIQTVYKKTINENEFNPDDKNNNNSISPSKRRSKNMKIFGGLNIFNKNKKNKIDDFNNINTVNNITVDINENKKDKEFDTTQKFNIFFKKLSSCPFISHLESNLLINFVKNTKNYFTDYLFYVEKIIKIKNQNINDNKEFIFEKTSDTSIAFDPINILRNFTNNKCFIILKEFSYIDLYIYLYDLYDNNIEKSKDKKKSKIEIINEIIKNINIFKETCNKNFTSKKSSIVIGKVNFIIHKYFLILNQYFNDNKIFFNEENRIIILDKFTHTDCILDNGHITIVLNNNIENDGDKDIKDNKNEDYFVKFHTTFLYEYDIIKYIMDKKLLKFNKLDIIVKKKILQINNGQIQLKKINLNYSNNASSDDIEKIKNIEKEENKILEKKDGEELNIDNIEINKKISSDNVLKDKSMYNENYNLFKIKDLFKYQNSYPLIIFFLQNETEISHFPFLLFTFSELFLSKSYKELTKELLIRRIIKFFYRFRNSILTPVIFNKKYFSYFLNFFEPIINKLQKTTSQESNKSLIKQNDGKNQQIFQNLIFFPINNNNTFDDIKDSLSNQGIFNNLVKNISIFKIDNKNEISYNISQIGIMFKFHRIIDTITELGKISDINIENGNIIIYNINSENLINLIKKNQKKVKFIGIDKENRTMNVLVFNGNDLVTKIKTDKNIDSFNNNCFIY